jgi:hypothetical protein
MSFETLLLFDLVQSEREHIPIYGRGESFHGLTKRGGGLDPRWINGGRRIFGGYRELLRYDDGGNLFSCRYVCNMNIDYPSIGGFYWIHLYHKLHIKEMDNCVLYFSMLCVLCPNELFPCTGCRSRGLD